MRGISLSTPNNMYDASGALSKLRANDLKAFQLPDSDLKLVLHVMRTADRCRYVQAREGLGLDTMMLREELPSYIRPSLI